MFLNQPFDLVVQVRKTGIRVERDGQTFLDWKGNPSQLSLGSTWTDNGPPRLFLGAQAQFEIQRRVARPEQRDGRGAASNNSNHLLPDGQGTPLTDAGRVGHDNNPVLLTGVDLSGLQTLKDADLARLADRTTLRDLQLHNTSLTGACLTHIQRLSRLQVLSLAVLPIADQHLAALSELKQ